MSPINTNWYQVPSVNGTITGISNSLCMDIDASLSNSKPSFANSVFKLSACLLIDSLLQDSCRITSCEPELKLHRSISENRRKHGGFILVGWGFGWIWINCI